MLVVSLTRRDTATKVLANITGDGSELPAVIIRGNEEAQGGGRSWTRASRQSNKVGELYCGSPSRRNLFIWFHALDLDSKTLHRNNRIPLFQTTTSVLRSI